VVSCKATLWWQWYSRLAIGIAAGGGVLMLLAAAVAHDAASIPLLVLGGGWLLASLVGLWQAWRTVGEIVLNGDTVEFRSPSNRRTIPAGDILEVDRPWWDTGHMGYLRFRTRADGNIKVVPRLQGTFEFLVELQRLNPELRVKAF
jgi:hypothetical protein